MMSKLSPFANLDFFKEQLPLANKIFVLGDLMLDEYVHGDVSRISPEAPVPVLVAKRSEEKIGGAGNVAVNLAEWISSNDPRFFFASVVGDDEAADKLSAIFSGRFSQQNVLLAREAERTTTVKKRFVAQGYHQVLRVDFESTRAMGGKSQKKILEILEDHLDQDSILVLQDYDKGFFDAALMKELLGIGQKNGAKTLVDPHRNRAADFYQGAFLIKPNLAEAELLLGRSLDHLAGAESESAVEEVLQELKERTQAQNVLLTRSYRGMSLLAANSPAAKAKESLHFPSIARNVYDVTGAGDTVLAALAFGLASERSWEEILSLAVLSSAIVVSKAGTATASREELLALAARQ